MLFCKLDSPGVPNNHKYQQGTQVWNPRRMMSLGTLVRNKVKGWVSST